METEEILKEIKKVAYKNKPYKKIKTDLLQHIRNKLEYFNYHNKNLTKTQYYTISEVLDLIKYALEGKDFKD